MTKITDMTRCAGLNHITFTIERDGGQIIKVTKTIDELSEMPSMDDDYVNQRLSLLKREANANGATTYNQIRTYLLNRDFVE